jgi:hypothetical protein
MLDADTGSVSGVGLEPITDQFVSRKGAKKKEE